MTGTQTIESFTDLHAWQEAHRLVLQVYRLAKKLPDDETYGLTSQLKRAAVSISSSIAEGFSRDTEADNKHFFTIALSSLSEVQNQLLIAKDLEHISQKEFDGCAQQSVVVGNLTGGLRRSAFSRNV